VAEFQARVMINATVFGAHLHYNNCLVEAPTASLRRITLMKTRVEDRPQSVGNAAGVAARVPLTRLSDDGRRIVERILEDVDGITSLDVAAFNSSI
jgi:hypothetical protein